MACTASAHLIYLIIYKVHAKLFLLPIKFCLQVIICVRTFNLCILEKYVARVAEWLFHTSNTIRRQEQRGNFRTKFMDHSPFIKFEYTKQHTGFNVCINHLNVVCCLQNIVFLELKKKHKKHEKKLVAYCTCFILFSCTAINNLHPYNFRMRLQLCVLRAIFKYYYELKWCAYSQFEIDNDMETCTESILHRSFCVWVFS